MNTSLLLIFFIVALGSGITYHITRQIRHTIGSLTGGLELLHTGLEEQEKELEKTPKSVNGMTSLCIPRITADFPEFNWYEFRQKAENMLKSALLAITKEDASLVTGASKDLKTQIELTIKDNRGQQVHEIYKNITIHQTEIMDYRKTGGSCIITLQSSAGFLHYKTKAGGIMEGSDTSLKQTRFNIELLYIQDADKVADMGNAFSITCPSCGAPVTDIGQKTCAYCGCAIAEINIHAWALNRYYET